MTEQGLDVTGRAAEGSKPVTFRPSWTASSSGDRGEGLHSSLFAAGDGSEGRAHLLEQRMPAVEGQVVPVQVRRLAGTGGRVRAR
jgi:hypothetical protein